MNILIFTSLDPTDINNWSGTSWHIRQALSKKNNVEVLGANVLKQAVYYSSKNFADKSVFVNYSPVYGELYSEIIRRKTYLDLVFFGDLQMASDLDVNLPIVHLSDVNFHFFKDYRSSARSEEQTLAIEEKEKTVLNKYDSIIYSSEWIKRETIKYYGINPDKIHVVEFGANIPKPSDFQIDIQREICNLVFIGKDWNKKGGNKALGAFRKLKSDGFPCTLTIIGSKPSEPCLDEKGLTIIPFLDKAIPEHFSLFCRIMRESHFLVLPTEFDCFGIVFCEASAYAVPSLATDIAGVGQPLREGINGYLLPVDATAEDYANKIRAVFKDKEGYRNLRSSSRREFERRLNWDVWLDRVQPILEETVRNFRKKGV